MRWRWHPFLAGCGPVEEPDWPGAQPVPCYTRGAAPRAPWPRFAFTATLLNQAGNVPRKAGKWAAQEAALEEIGQVRSRLRYRSAEGHTQIKYKAARAWSSVRPQGRDSQRTPHRGRAAARRRSRCRARECIGRHAALLLSSMPSFLCLLFMQQASRAGKQDLVCFQCNAFCLKREQAEQPFVFLNTIFLSKRNIGVVGTWGVATRAAGPPRRQGCNAATTAAAAGGRKRQQQQRQHGCLCWWHTANFFCLR